jgi:hypothetical protein
LLLGAHELGALHVPVFAAASYNDVLPRAPHDAPQVCLGLAVAAYRRGDNPRREYEERMGGPHGIQMHAAA